MTIKAFFHSRIIFALLTAAVMVGIFFFSCENSDESSNTSGVFVDIIIDVSIKDFDSKPVEEQTEISETLSHVIRKCAHFSVYAVLGFFASLTAWRRRLFSLSSLMVIAFCFLYACTDELHQYFVPGRSCMFTDVLIDTCGGMTGMLISFLFLKKFAKKAVP